MKKNNLFEFSVNRENHTMNVKRQFHAPRSRVWKAWTDPQILDQWWAPKPWKSITKSMVFKEGSQRIYTMVGPNGEEHWSFARYISIVPETHFTFHDGFCDENGNLMEELPRSAWNVDFNDQNGSTLVTVTIKHESLSELETILEMGFKEGLTMVLDNLDELLA